MADLDWLINQLKHTDDKPAVLFDKQKIAKELIAYGEPGAADALLALDDPALGKIGLLAHKHYSTFPGETGPMLDTAICRAVVEHLEGRARPLARKRRVYPKGPR